MSIDYDVALKIAKLSRLKLTKAQTDKIVEELSEVLNLYKNWKKLTPPSVSPMNMVNPIEPKQRSDNVDDGNYREKS